VSKAKDGYEILKDGFSGEAYEDVRKGLELAEAIAASVRFHPAENRQSNWEIISIQGRDYVTASNLERFFKFRSQEEVKPGLLQLYHPSMKAEIDFENQEFRFNNIRVQPLRSFQKQDGDYLISTPDLTLLFDPIVRPTHIKKWKSEPSEICYEFHAKNGFLVPDELKGKLPTSKERPSAVAFHFSPSPDQFSMKTRIINPFASGDRDPFTTWYSAVAMLHHAGLVYELKGIKDLGMSLDQEESSENEVPQVQIHFTVPTEFSNWDSFEKALKSSIERLERVRKRTMTQEKED
jgi:hypothetical protein